VKDIEPWSNVVFAMADATLQTTLEVVSLEAAMSSWSIANSSATNDVILHRNMMTSSMANAPLKPANEVHVFSMAVRARCVSFCSPSLKVISDVRSGKASVPVILMVVLGDLPYLTELLPPPVGCCFQDGCAISR
jgi:hypothetical protein